MNLSALDPQLVANIRRGTVIPAHPLALTADGSLDIAHQRALTRYYVDCGAGGIAVGVHSTQFEIRDPDVALYRPVLELAADTVDHWAAEGQETFAMIAGVCGPTDQALDEGSYETRLCRHVRAPRGTAGLWADTAVAGLEALR